MLMWFVFMHQLSVTCELSMKVASYNERLAVWELIVEPVEIEGKHRPWEIFLKVLFALLHIFRQWSEDTVVLAICLS